MTTISVDRLLALLLGLRYRQVVTLKRTWVIVFTLWVVSTAFSATWFWNSLITFWYGFIAILLCLVTSIFFYTKILITLRHQQNQLQDHAQQPNQANQLNISRYKKAFVTAIWLQLTLIACYLPYCIVAALWTHKGLSPSIVNSWSYASSLVMLNSSLNPILYCWKLEEVTQEVKNTIRQVLCHCFRVSTFSLPMKRWKFNDWDKKILKRLSLVAYKCCLHILIYQFFFLFLAVVW